MVISNNYNKSGSNSSKSNSPRRDYSRRAPRANNAQSKPQQREKRNLILLKSSVYALFIVFVVLLAAFLIYKDKKTSLNIKKAECKNNIIKISSNIDKTIDLGSSILIVTKEKSGNQEIVKLDKKCLSVRSRTIFNISGK